jgi:hypothetical protein
MRNATRERVVRILLAAFANSNLTIEELEEICDDILNRPEYALDLRSILQKVIHTLRDNTPQKHTVYVTDDPLHQALTIIRRRKFAKTKIEKMMEAAAPGYRPIGRNRNLSVTQIIENFFESASEIQRTRFLDLLSPPRETDPYLRGIIGRR